MSNEEILAVLNSSATIEFPEATDAEIEIALEKHALKNGNIQNATNLISSSGSPEAECCDVAACSGSC